MLVSVREACPSCETYFGVRLLFGQSTGLGPSTYVCSHCGLKVASGRQEWDDLSAWNKTRYVIVSLLYAALLAIFGGAFFGTAVRRIELGPSAPEVPLDGFLEYLPFAVGVGVAVAFLQVGRVIW